MNEAQANFTPYIRVPIPTAMLFNEDLTYKDKLLYLIIAELSYQSGACTASNKYLASLLDILPRNIQTAISKLHRLRVITIDLKQNNKRSISIPQIRDHKIPNYKDKPRTMQYPDYMEFVNHMRKNYVGLIFTPYIWNKTYTEDYKIEILPSGYLMCVGLEKNVSAETSNKLWKLLWHNQDDLLKQIDEARRQQRKC